MTMTAAEHLAFTRRAVRFSTVLMVAGNPPRIIGPFPARITIADSGKLTRVLTPSPLDPEVVRAN